MVWLLRGPLSIDEIGQVKVFAEANVREGNVAVSLDIVNDFNTLPWGERGDGIFPDAPLPSRLKTESSLGYEDPTEIDIAGTEQLPASSHE